MLRDPELAQPFAEELIQRFDSQVRTLFDERDVDRGFYEIVNRSGRRETVPLPSLTVALVNHVTERAMHRIGLKLFKHLHKLDLDFHLSRRTGGMARDIERGTNGRF